MVIPGPGPAPARPMKTVIIVSKCMKEVKLTASESWFHFHFRGVCAGEALRKVVLRGRRDFGLKKGEEYLLYVQLINFDEGTLVGTILRAKRLEECWDRSGDA